MGARTLLFWGALCACLGPARALYFLVFEEKRCFSIEQPRNTPVVFNYEILDTDEVVMFDLYYGSKEDREAVIFHKTLRDASGHIDFVTDNEGDYLLCVQQASPRPAAEKHGGAAAAGAAKKVTAEVVRHPTRFRLAINYGYDSEYYEKLGKKENFDTINLDVRRLNDMLGELVLRLSRLCSDLSVLTPSHTHPPPPPPPRRYDAQRG